MLSMAGAKTQWLLMQRMLEALLYATHHLCKAVFQCLLFEGASGLRLQFGRAQTNSAALVMQQELHEPVLLAERFKSALNAQHEHHYNNSSRC